MMNNYPYIVFEYDITSDDRKREVEDFYKILDLFSFDDMLQSSQISLHVLRVNWLDVRSVINGGSYYKVLVSLSSYWNEEFISNYNFINKYQSSEMSTRTVSTFQKLMIQFKKTLKILKDTTRHDKRNVVKYTYQYRGVL